MILYHGSYTEIRQPGLALSRNNVDFGKGFYTTPFKEQAERWAERFKVENQNAVVSAYSFLENVNETLEGINILEFNAHTRQWLNFIADCRRGNPATANIDIVIGGVANDKIFNTLELYFNGAISANEAIRRLRYNKPNYQYCFKKQSIIDRYLHFLSSETI
jgi:hypothetical protein